jgi:hypothetical protein
VQPLDAKPHDADGDVIELQGGGLITSTTGGLPGTSHSA